MGTTFYSKPEQGGIIFRTTRRPGDVRIPNYVYDMWMPLLGACALGVYATYCRLEMGGAVKKITLATLAKACRIGTGKLNKINAQLQDCGFIQLNKPTGSAKLMHWTTEIVVQDPPIEVNQEFLDKYAPPSGYEVLTPWLMESPKNPDGFFEQPKTEPRNDPEPDSNIETLEILKPLDIEPSANAESQQSSPQKEPDVQDVTITEVAPVEELPGTVKPWRGPPPAAARVYQSHMSRWPRRTQYRRLHETVGDEPDALDFWGKVVGEYDALGWNPMNVAGMLEWFERREMPHVTPKGSGGSRQTRGDRNREIIAGWFAEEQWVDAGNGVEVRL